MKKILYLAARQTGKSRIAVYEFLKDPASSILLTYNQKSVQRFIKEFNLGDYRENVISPSDLVNRYQYPPNNAKRIIVDEYWFLDTKIRYQLSTWYSVEKVDELIAVTTPRKLYDSWLIERVTKEKLNTSLEKLQKVHKEKC